MSVAAAEAARYDVDQLAPHVDAIAQVGAMVDLVAKTWADLQADVELLPDIELREVQTTLDRMGDQLGRMGSAIGALEDAASVLEESTPTVDAISQRDAELLLDIARLAFAHPDARLVAANLSTPVWLRLEAGRGARSRRVDL